MKDIETQIRELLISNIENLGYNLYDIEYAKENKENYLRIFIDSINPITIDDCEIVSKSISDLLDKADLIEETYFLEVSSSGERKNEKGGVIQDEGN